MDNPNRLLSAAFIITTALILIAMRGNKIQNRIPVAPKGWINLGSAFLVEDWLCTSMTDEERWQHDLAPWRWHMSAMTKEEMEQHLQERISRENFQAMADYGVGVVRVPVGYWNFLDESALERMAMGPSTPVADEDLLLMRKLHEVMTPAEYAVHLRRLFALALEFDVRLLLDLHGLPGSQNGEMHSGQRESKNKSTVARAARTHFDSAINCRHRLSDQTLGQAPLEPRGHVPCSLH